MKTRLPLSLLAALLAAFPSAIAAPAGTDLGNVMYVGDSITHGMNSGTYRWALHKIFADNGISYHAEGVKTGNYSGGVTAGTSYGGQVFNNEHSSQASARAWEISGRKPEAGLTAPTSPTGWGFPMPKQTEQPTRARPSRERTHRIPFS